MKRHQGERTETPGSRGNGGRYRKVLPRIWSNTAFLALRADEKLVALYVLTGPRVNRIGLYQLSPGAAAEDFGLSVKVFRRRLDRVVNAFEWQFDEQSRVLWIPSWWRFNAPEGPNQLKGVLTDLAEVPPSSLKDLFCRHIATLPTETLRRTFTETIGQTFTGRSPEPLPEHPAEPSPIQEQEQEQDQEQEGFARKGPGNPSRARRHTRSGVLNGALPRDHVDHAACDDTHARCVPRAVHDKLANRLAPRHRGDRAAAGEALKAWYPAVWARLPADFVMGDAFKFWQGQFDATFATKDQPPAAAVRPSGCYHAPPCRDEVACTALRRAESLSASSAPPVAAGPAS